MGNSHDKKRKKEHNEVLQVRAVDRGGEEKSQTTGQPVNTNRTVAKDVDMRERKGRNPSDLYQSEKVSLKDSRPVQYPHSRPVQEHPNSRPGQEHPHSRPGQEHQHSSQTPGKQQYSQLSHSTQGNSNRTQGKHVAVVVVGGTSNQNTKVVNNPSSRNGEIPTRKGISVDSGNAEKVKPVAVNGRTSHVASTTEVMAESVIAFENLIAAHIKKYVELSHVIGGDVQTQADLVQQAFQAQKEFLVQASRSKLPSQNVLMELLKPTSEKIQAIVDCREKNRRSNFFNHLSAISESVPCLGWVNVSPTPGPFVKDMADAGTFYSNRVLMEYKGKDQNHVDWTKSWTSALTELQAFIKEYHRTGLEWNSSGGDAQVQSTPKVQAPVAPGPPPPPPPPPPSVDSVSPSGGTPAEIDRSALLSDLSKGLDVTKGLKRVTDDMKTHKNPVLRQGPVPYKPATGPKPYVKPASTTPSKPVAPKAVEKPPVTELQNRKWIVEYHKNNPNIVIEDVELKQTVYVFRCQESTIMVKGKVNSITLDSCKKVGIVFDDVLSALEFVNCQSVQGQVNGKCPTISIDKTDGCLIYLSSESTNAEIVTAKSSEMNILIPKGDGDYVEFPVPEQFKSIYNGKKLVTACADL